MGRCGIIAAYAGFTNQFNIGALMEKGVRFIGNGQAPVHLYWEEILNDYIIPGKMDPTLSVHCIRIFCPTADNDAQHHHTSCSDR
jgi:threonine dehydrogenase-like Zn-dependent dehydrogenase